MALPRNPQDWTTVYEGKTVIYTDGITPISLAARLAEYISDPSTIRVRVMDHFGRAPSVQRCAELRDKALGKRRQWMDGNLHADKFKIHCATHNGPYELDVDGYDRCTICTAERLDVERREREKRQALEAIQAEAKRQKEQREREKLEAIKQELLASAEAVEGSDKPLLFYDLLLSVAAAFKVTPSDIIGQKRSRIYVDARTALAQILKLRGSSYPMIGKRMKRDHSSIISLLSIYDVRAKRNPVIALVVEQLA